MLEKFRKSFASGDYVPTNISDGIVLHIESNRIENNGAEAIERIFRNIGEKQLEFILETGYLIRGGIALGTRYLHK